MSDTPPILISLTSFGAAEVMRHGQLYFADLSRKAGADGVEVRGELLASPTDAAELAALRATGFVRVFSSPDGLWTTDGDLDTAALQQALDIAAQLGAGRVKMAIGGFNARSAATLENLKTRLLADADCELVIENDQSTSAGTLGALRCFFAAADAAGLPLPMTFDIGNWHYLGECPLQAVTAFAHRVAYVHTKGVQRRPDKWVAVPLAESAAPWRAVLRGLPADVPWAIEYPLIGDDLVATTRREVEVLRAAARLQLATA